MKKLIVTAIALLLVGTSFAEKEKIVESKIEDVTVFLQGAQIHRKAKIYVEKGVTKIVLEGMTSSFNKNSIQVKGKGDFIIMDVSTRIHYPVPEKVVASSEIPLKIIREIDLLNDSLAQLNWRIYEVDNDVQIFESEKSLLLTSGVIKGQVTNDSILALKDAMDYMRLKMMEINGLLLKAKKKKADYSALQVRMNNRMAALQNYNANTVVPYQPKNMDPVQQIVVSVSSDLATSGYLEVSYMVANAGWSPAYDLRADDINSPVKLTYKANVYQSTGVNWDNVNIKLSTINPNRSNDKPSLAPWYIDFYKPVVYPTYGGAAYKDQSMDDDEYSLKEAVPSSAARADNSKKYESKMNDAQQMANYTQMTEKMAMVEFELSIAQSIPSDGQYHMMAVKSENIKSSFEHFIVPKMDTDAFLVAHLTNWEELNLLPAVANIYYDGTYVGQTRINPNVMSDTLDLALGRDRGIYVTRKKTNDEEKIKTLSNEKSKTVTYEIAIKNYKSSTVNLTIEDQLPISQIEEIKVEMGEISEAEYIKNEGRLVWKQKIESKGTRKFSFTYTLKFDKDKQLALN